MLTEQAEVVEITDQGVTVETVRRSACDSCRSQSGCGQKLLAELGQAQRFQIIAVNPKQLPLSPGDRVELGIEERSFLQASLITYLSPLLGLVLCALLGQGLGLAEPMQILLGVVGLVFGFVGVRWWGRGERQGCQLQPKIVGMQKTYDFIEVEEA
ncbi:SoxR reducing system RseC family protein [Motiliproteus sp.]|uniref:SoxR reducing system RseC family protein n=1 Tax=Motiliproteus sp. TaxID=1898955 RepID=UPI003BAD060A